MISKYSHRQIILYTHADFNFKFWNLTDLDPPIPATMHRVENRNIYWLIIHEKKTLLHDNNNEDKIHAIYATKYLGWELRKILASVFCVQCKKKKRKGIYTHFCTFERVKCSCVYIYTYLF